MITNFYINIKDPMVTDSWVLTVYTSEGYAIDQIKSGLSLKFVCTAPCLTCVANGATLQDSKRCTSCNTITKDIILYKETCIARCPARTFYDDSTYGCKDCNSNCLECNYENGNECTSCDPKGSAPFLDGVVCKATCPFGTYADRDLHKCMPCQAPCQSCNSGPLDCNTCDFKSKKRYFEAGKCLTGCDPGYTVPLDRTDFLCVECDPNCETCAIDPKNCLTCKPKGAAFLSLHDNTCHAACPAGITVGKPGVEKHCQTCTGKCQTCHGKPDFCTSCAKEFSLDEAAGECVRDCAESKQGNKVIKHQTRVALDGKCVNCASPCATCETTKDYCLTCEAGLVMHEYKCLQ
jgi:proprotein convertase subtilisin/kexin type 5